MRALLIGFFRRSNRLPTYGIHGDRIGLQVEPFDGPWT